MKIYDIKTPQELLDFMNKNIEYGWLDAKKNPHYNNMKNFRSLYRTATIGECLVDHLGTCIEQTMLEKMVFNNLHIPNKAYCLRSFVDDTTKEDPRMHCFLLYFMNDKCYHFEHSNPEKRGIHPYENEEQALNDILSYFQEKDKGDTRELVEFTTVLPNLSWIDWNSYISSLIESNKKIL